MRIPTIAFGLALGLLLGAVAFTACDEDEFFMDCPLSDSIISACEADSQATTLTCVVEDHPLCADKICAKWRDSDPFCSKVCAADSDCPTGSSCQSYLDFDICVPDAVLATPLAQ